MSSIFVGVYDMHYDGQQVEFVASSLEKAEGLMLERYPRAKHTDTNRNHREYDIGARQTSYWISEYPLDSWSY
jgi:hypothetical protein